MPNDWIRGIGPDGKPKSAEVDADGNLKVVTNAPITASPLARASHTFTRPNTTTQYAAQDEVSNNATAGSVVPLLFEDIAGDEGGGGYIIKAELKITGIPATASPTNAIFRLYLLQAIPANVGDNVAFPLLGADLDDTELFVDFAVITEGTGSTALYGLDDGLRTGFQCADGSRDLYGVLVAKAAYTPTAQSIWTIRLMAEGAG